MKLTKIQRKKYRVRNKVKKFSSSERYRLCVNRSTKNISAQIIDDEKKVTLVSASSNTKDIKSYTTVALAKSKKIYLKRFHFAKH